MRGQIGGEPVAAIAAVCKDVLDERKQAAGLLDEVHSPVPVLDACGHHLDAKQQSDRIGECVTLDAFDLFARVKANEILVLPPFSVAFAA